MYTSETELLIKCAEFNNLGKITLDYTGGYCIIPVRVMFLPTICLSERRYLFPSACGPQSAAVAGRQKRINFLKRKAKADCLASKRTEISEKGKPRESAGRKATGPKALGRGLFAMAARPPIFRLFFQMRGERNNGKNEFEEKHCNASGTQHADRYDPCSGSG